MSVCEVNQKPSPANKIYQDGVLMMLRLEFIICTYWHAVLEGLGWTVDKEHIIISFV